MSSFPPASQLLRQQVLTGAAAAAAPAATDSPGRSIWSSLAVGVIAQRVGARPQAGGFAIAPAPDSSRTPCSAAAAASLQAILNPEDALLLPEWCRLAAASGSAAPPLYLPALLNWAGKDEERRALLKGICGTRESWLAGFRSDWAWVSDAAADAGALRQQWEDGKESERIAAFATMRRQDPAQARQWLLDGWADCPADVRTAGVSALSVGLSCADEALLEQALDDRRKTVREAAQALLAVLPESSYLQRTAAIARQAFVVQRSGLLRRRKLETAQPRLDPAAARDGWDVGREWVADDYRKLLQRTPLSYWTQDCGMSPQESIEQILELGADFLLALFKAVQDRGSAEWLHAALDAVDHAFLVAIGGSHQRADQVPLALIANLPQPDQCPTAERLLSLMSGPWWTQAVGLALPAGWSREFTRRYAEQLRSGIEQPGHVGALPAALQLAVLRGDASALHPLVQKALETTPTWAADDSLLTRYRSAWQEALRLLDKRLAVRQSFSISSNGSTS